MGLGKVVAQAAGTQASIKKLIKLNLIREQEVPPLTLESYLRVSSMHKFCAREEVLASTLKINRQDSVDADLSLIFAHGTGLHYALQNQVLADIGVLVGEWRCVDCAKQYGKLEGDLATSQTLVRKPKICDCGCKDFNYREQHFINKELRVGGHPDGFLILPGMEGLGIIECKSISSRGAWEVRDIPKMDHVVQIQSYFWLTGLKWGKILYWDKGGHGLSALAEHTIERDEEAIGEIKSLVSSIWRGLASGELPERICETNSCPKAKECPLVKQCFGAKEEDPF